MNHIFFVATLLVASTRADDAVAEGIAGVPPGVGFPQGIPPGIGGGFPGGFGGIFPGFGFQKNLDISAGAGLGPFGGLGALGGLGGLGGFGGVPPVDGVGVGPDGAPVLGGGYPPFGLIGPSYIPATWLGSALGAKGDILFPIVLFVFFVVGVWTIIQFLLGLIVPLIAGKLSVLKGVTDIERKAWRRGLPDSPQENRENEVNHLTTIVMSAIENVQCMQKMACHTGNFVHTIAGDKLKDYVGPMAAMNTMSPEMSKIFKQAAKTGKEDCSKFTCHGFSGEDHHDQHNLNEKKPANKNANV